MYRIGQSQDIHAFIEGKPLILGGVLVDYDKGLKAHSDGDCLLHAIIEAIIGALALKDIGTHFKDTDPKYKDISSMILLEKTYDMMKQAGYKIENLDSIIIIEEPKMAPYIDKMVENIAQVLHCRKDQVNVKATRAEGLGFVGNKEGIICQAIVLVSKI